MHFITFLLIGACVIASSYGDSAVQALDDSSFEINTQIGSGATTGDWFIEFYAPWCSHCRQLEPVWEALAKEMQGVMNVAKIDVTVNPQTTSRFKITGMPTLKFFKGGLQYDYTSGERTLTKLVQFATEGYKKEAGVRPPKPLSALGSFLGQVEGFARELVTTGVKDYPLIFVLFLVGLGVIFGSIMTYTALIFSWGSNADPRPVEGASSTTDSDDHVPKAPEANKSD